MLKLVILNFLALISGFIYSPDHIFENTGQPAPVYPKRNKLQMVVMGLLRNIYNLLLVIFLFLIYLFMVCGTEIILAMVSS